METPALVVGQDSPLVAHFTDARNPEGFVWVTEGKVTATLRHTDAAEEVFSVDHLLRNGIFKPVVTPTHAGSAELILRLDGRGRGHRLRRHRRVYPTVESRGGRRGRGRARRARGVVSQGVPVEDGLRHGPGRVGDQRGARCAPRVSWWRPSGPAALGQPRDRAGRGHRRFCGSARRCGRGRARPGRARGRGDRGAVDADLGRRRGRSRASPRPRCAR
jgi:hypothetical protein